MIEIRKQPGMKVIDIGCGANRHPAADCAVDVRPAHGVDFTVNLEEPNWPISSDEWDCVLSVFALEHISWRNTMTFLKECYRITKPGGTLILITPNTEAQMEYLLKTEDWDVAGCMLFGDLDYPENSHKAFVNPSMLTRQLSEVGFENILIQPFGELKTDMATQATKPLQSTPKLPEPVKLQGGIFNTNVLGSNVESSKPPEPAKPPEPEPPREPLPPAGVVFDRRYWDGGNEWGGFQQGYQDFPCHEITAQHVLARKPTSVLQLGCARGYIVKRLQDAGVIAEGVDASRHCYLTRVSDCVTCLDFVETEWGTGGSITYDLCFSIATLDHIHEKDLPVVIRRMTERCRRGLHGINFGPPGNDRTRQTCKPREWWVDLFNKHAPNWPVEIVHKDELENGSLSPSFLAGDGKLKVQFGSHTSLFYHGWINTDDKDLSQYAQGLQARFKQVDVREGLPFDTESVDCIFHCHMLEHLSYKDGLSFLKECRRIMKPVGAMRIIVPDAEKLIMAHNNEALGELDELSGTCAAAKTSTQKLFELLYAHHFAMYDYETLATMLEEAGLKPYQSWFRKVALVEGAGSDNQKQILRECMDILPEISLFVEAYVPPI